MEQSVNNHRQREDDDQRDPKKESHRVCLNPARAIKKLTFDKIVLTHFFLVFLVSFVVGVLFLHSTYTFWDQVEEVDLNKVLEDLGVNKLPSFVNMDDTINDLDLTGQQFNQSIYAN